MFLLKALAQVNYFSMVRPSLHRLWPPLESYLGQGSTQTPQILSLSSFLLLENVLQLFETFSFSIFKELVVPGSQTALPNHWLWVLGSGCLASVGAIQQHFNGRVFVQVFLHSKHNKNKSKKGLYYWRIVTFLGFHVGCIIISMKLVIGLICLLAVQVSSLRFILHVSRADGPKCFYEFLST